MVPSSCGVISAERATKERIESGRWLHSGDIAVKDENGYIFIVIFVPLSARLRLPTPPNLRQP